MKYKVVLTMNFAFIVEAEGPEEAEKLGIAVPLDECEDLEMLAITTYPLGEVH